MIFYFAIFVIFSILSWCYSRSCKKEAQLFYLIWMYFLYAIVFVLRDRYVGVDTSWYIDSFYSDYAKLDKRIEPFFVLINKIFFMLHLSHFSFFLFVSSIIFVLCIKSFDKEDIYIILPLAYICIFIPSLNVLRQMLGISFAYRAIKRGDKFSYLYFILGGLIHNSIFIYTFIYIISKFIRIKSNLYYLISIAIILLTYTGVLVKFLFWIISFTPYSGYAYIVFDDIEIKFSIFNFVKISLYLFLHYYASLLQDKNKKSIYHALITCMIIAEIVVKINPIFFRVQTLFSPVLLFGVEAVCTVMKERNSVIDKVYLISLLSYSVVTFCLNLGMNNGSVIPFKFVNIYGV